MNEKMLAVVYPVIKYPTGNRRYAEQILKGLNDAGYRHKEVGIKKIEISLWGKPFGGIISQYLGMKMKSFDLLNSYPIHSLAPELTPKNGDIVTIHDIVPFIESAKFMRNNYDKRSYNLMYSNALNAKMLLSSTYFGKEELIRELKIQEDRVAVVYLSIDHSKFYPDPNNPYPDDGKIHLVTVGDFNPRKRFDLLFNIISKNKDMSLYHIGPVNSWKERAEMLKNMASKTENIKLLGSVDDGILRRYISNADAFVYISDGEGFGLPPIEALACGTNVVVNDLPVFKETIGSIASISGIENFEEAILKTVNNKRSREELISFSQRYSLKNEINNLIKLYGDFL
jgi:glycosyltransferase involved in cell wall biosynthesis